MKQRAKKRDPNSRCCWVCGKRGGLGFTMALRNAGYDVQEGEMAYVHANCMRRARLDSQVSDGITEKMVRLTIAQTHEGKP